MRLLTFLLTILFFMPSVMAKEDYTSVSDIPYSQKTDNYSKERLKLDIHHSNSKTGLPVIIWFHGGGLTGGEKYLPEELMEQGFVVVAPNYRLIPNVGVEECIDDAAESVAWTVENISQYGGDPSQIFVSGHSAGGFLTSMIGLDKKWLDKYGFDSDSIKGLIPFSGQVITHFSDRKKKNIGELTPYVDSNAPLFHVRKNSPPYIIITGDAETELYGRYEENLYMWRMMKLTGNPYVHIYKLDGYNHGDMVHPAFHIMKDEINAILSDKTSDKK